MKAVRPQKDTQLVHYSVRLDLAFLPGRRYFLDLSIDPDAQIIHRFNVRLDGPSIADLTFPAASPPSRT